MMSTARFTARAALTSVAAVLFLSACASAPDVAIVSPTPGSTLTVTQIEVDATSSAEDGSTAMANAGSGLLYAKVQAGKIHFPAVTFPTGAATLTVSVVDNRHDTLGQATAIYSVVSDAAGCKISSPKNHDIFAGDPGDTGLVSVVVQAVCHGLAAGVQAGILQNDDATPSQLQTPAADGSVSFTADLIPGANTISVVAKGVPFDVVEVDATSTRCRTEVEPPSGTVFNVAGTSGAVADTDPTTTGMQANLKLKTNCADGTSASLTVSQRGQVELTASSTVTGGVATFAITLPDGTLNVQGFVGAPGKEGASRVATYVSDGTSPTIVVLSPVQGGLLGPQDNLGTPTQFIARIRGQIAGFNSGGYAALEIDQGTAQAQEITIAPDLTNGIFSTDVVLSGGLHSLYAKVVRASGNTAVSPTIEFTVVTNGTGLAIVSPATGAEIGLALLTPNGDGTATVNFQLESAGLVGQTANIDCGRSASGTSITASGTIGNTGNATIALNLPIASCAGALFRCTATAGNAAAAVTTFTADDTAPTATISAPASGPSPGGTTEFKATTSCTGEGQLFTLDNGGTVISSGSVQGNLIDVPDVALHTGQNQFHLILTDGAGNTSTSEVDVTAASTIFPVAAFVQPTSGQVLTSSSTNLDCTVPARPVLKQVQVSITGDTVAPSGMALKLTNSGGSQTISQTPTLSGNVYTYTNVAILPETNTLSVTATDAAMATGQASVTFSDRCSSLAVMLTFVVNGTNFGYAQDKDHGTAGEQVDAQVQATAANGSPIRLCSTALSVAPNGCVTAGTGLVPVVQGSPTIQNNIAVFTVTLPDGPQTITAEVTDVATDVSNPTTVHVRATPPTVKSITLSEDTRGQTLMSLPDNALNQVEMDASNGNVHFQVVFGPGSFVAGQKISIFATQISPALGSTVIAANGDGTTATTVTVPLSSLNVGGYQSDVFYASVVDDANNPVSTPSAIEAGVPATTLGTTSAPFVIAPDPTVALTAPAPGTTELNALNDDRCVNAVCPEADPLRFAFAASTTAPDSSTSGATSTITFLANGSAIVPLAGEHNPTNTSGGTVNGVVLPISNAPSVSLAAQVEDPYGNIVTSAADTLIVDSIAPALAITTVGGNSTAAGAVTINQPSVSAVVAIDTGGQGTLESGETVTIYADGTAVGSGTYSGSSSGPGSITITIAVDSGFHNLVAKASDAAGNPGASAAVGVLQTYTGPTLALSSPPPVAGGTLYLGTATQSGNVCAPPLQYATTNVPDGDNVLIWVVAAGSSSCGNAPGNARMAAVTSNSATLPSTGGSNNTAFFGIADGATGRFCAQVSDNSGNTAQATPQAFQCDLQTPTVSWASPTANQLFVGFGQSQISGATTSTSSVNTKLGIASAQLAVKAPNGGTLTLSVDQDNTPTVTTTQFVSCTVPAASGVQTIYALSANNCSTTNSGGQVLVPIDYAQLLAHTLTANFIAPSGNAAAVATQGVRIDIAPPASVSPALTIKLAIGVATVTIATVPGDDQTAGPPPVGWEVRYSTTALTTSNWGSGTLVTANLAGAFPTGVPSTFQVVLPGGNQTLYVGVRAKDRVGNLGDLVSSSVVQTTTLPTGSTIALKDDSGASPLTPGIYAEAMRVADLDGDGFDDIVLNYSSTPCHPDTFCDGRILVYFGGAGGVSNPNAPLVLKGKIAEGGLGGTQSFDVGDFDADGKADIIAGESDYFSASDVLIWRGTTIAAWRAAGANASVPPAAVTLTDSSGSFIGGTVRAAGHITGGIGTGDDAAISNFSLYDGAAGPYELALLQRGGAWSKTGTKVLFSTGSPATSLLILPATVASTSGTNTNHATVELAPFTYAGASGDLSGVAVSLVDTFDNSTTTHEIKLFGASQIAPTVPWSAGVALPSPSTVAAADQFGYYLAGGQDAIGDAHADLLISDQSNGAIYAYDGAALLGPSVSAEPSSPTLLLNPTTELAPGATNVSYEGAGASFLPDLDGDGKAEMAGAIEPSGHEPLDIWFGQPGDAPLPALPFINTCTNSSATVFCFQPPRGQHIVPAPVFTMVPFGQRVGSGHVTALTGRDVVVLSQPINTGSAQGYLVILR
jgi:hypothetical protein